MINDILTLLRQATGPDRAIDWAIHCRNGIEGVGMYGNHPHYTSSIDDAAKIVPEGCEIQMLWGKKTPWAMIHKNKESPPYGKSSGSHGATPAIAILIATLDMNYDF